MPVAVFGTVDRPLAATFGPAKTHLGAQQLANRCRYFDRHCELRLTGAGRLAPRDQEGDTPSMIEAFDEVALQVASMRRRYRPDMPEAR